MIRRQANVRLEAVERTHTRGRQSLRTLQPVLALVGPYHLDLVSISDFIRAILLSTLNIDQEQVVHDDHLRLQASCHRACLGEKKVLFGQFLVEPRCDSLAGAIGPFDGHDVQILEALQDFLDPLVGGVRNPVAGHRAIVVFAILIHLLKFFVESSLLERRWVEH